MMKIVQCILVENADTERLLEESELEEDSNNINEEQIPAFIVHERIVKQLKDVLFDEDSDDDDEWIPSRHEYYNNSTISLQKKKRKTSNTLVPTSIQKQKKKTCIGNQFSCDVCGSHFTRIDNLKHHISKKHVELY